MFYRGSFIARPLSLGLAMLVFVAAAAHVSAATSPYIEGIDVSHWQNTPDWSAAITDGVKFAVLKATDGPATVDEQYANNRAQAESLALPVTAYHFARPDLTPNDAVLEADHFVDNAALKGKNLLPVLDLEVDGGLGPKKLRAWAKAWLARVQVRLGVKAIIYTSPSFWDVKMGNSRWFADNGHRLWIAHWGAAQPNVPAENWGGRGWTLWQHSATGSVAGFDGDVDLDRYAGTTLGPLKIRNNR